MVAAPVVASNWQPCVNGSLSDPAGFDPSRSSAALWENKFEVHLDMPRDDSVFRIFGVASRPLTRTVSHLSYLFRVWHALDML